MSFAFILAVSYGFALAQRRKLPLAELIDVPVESHFGLGLSVPFRGECRGNDGIANLVLREVSRGRNAYMRLIAVRDFDTRLVGQR